MLNVLDHNFVLFTRCSADEFMSFLRKHNHNKALVNNTFYFITIRRIDSLHFRAEVLFPGSRGFILNAQFDLSSLESEGLVDVRLGIAPPFRGIIILALLVYFVGLIFFLWLAPTSMNLKLVSIFALSIPMLLVGAVVRMNHAMRKIEKGLEFAMGQISE